MVAHTAETYRTAAMEHVALAYKLHHELQQYGAAHYWAGLAVECILRAYRVRTDPQFDSRHDVKDLVKQACFYDFVPERSAKEVAAAVATVADRWSNGHRFRPAAMIERWLKDKRLDRAVSGDRLKYSSAKIVDAALSIVHIGDQRWTSKSSPGA